MLKDFIEQMLTEAKEVRKPLSREDCELVGTRGRAPAGDYLANHARCLFNRQLDIFDDAMLLLDNGRVPSACSISRAMIETYAVARLLANTIADLLGNKKGKGTVDECLKVVLKFVNSSRIKETEQKKMEKGIFSPNDYSFTEQAQYRLQNKLATSEHVMDALRGLYKDERNSTQLKESEFELLYDMLSEWVHPSQTSVFHNYVRQTHIVPTSRGMFHIHDSAKANCARALHFIVDSWNTHQWLLSLATELTRREAA